MSRKEKITFAPQGEAVKSNSLPRYFWYVVAGAAAIFLISSVVILALNDFDLSLAIGKRTTEPVTEEVTTLAEDDFSAESLQDLTDSLNFLALCGDGENVSFCTVVSVLPSDALIRIKPISPDCVLESAFGKAELSEFYRKGDITSVIEGFGKKSIPISRYVLMNEEGFMNLIKKLGDINIELENSYEFNVDAILYTFPAGTAVMGGDAILSYMKHASVGDDLLRQQAKAASAIIRTHFTQGNIAKGESFFASVINNVTTDITIFDYTSSVSVVKAMEAKGIEISVIS